MFRGPLLFFGASTTRSCSAQGVPPHLQPPTRRGREVRPAAAATDVVQDEEWQMVPWMPKLLFVSTFLIPFGKHTRNYGKSQFSWVNQL